MIAYSFTVLLIINIDCEDSVWTVLCVVNVMLLQLLVQVVQVLFLSYAKEKVESNQLT